MADARSVTLSLGRVPSIGMKSKYEGSQQKRTYDTTTFLLLRYGRTPSPSNRFHATNAQMRNRRTEKKNREGCSPERIVSLPENGTILNLVRLCSLGINPQR